VGEKVRSTIQKRDAKGVIRHGAEWLTIWSDPESLRSDAERRARSETERRLAAAARSISRNPALQVNVPPEAHRGEIDSRALLHRFHSAERHRLPADPAERRLFDLCERVRCEALGAQLYPGVAENLETQHVERMEAADLLNAHLASLVPLTEALRMVLRDALLERPEPSIPSVGFRMWDQWIRARFAAELDALRLAIEDQAAFAKLSLDLIRRLLSELGSDEGHKRRFTPSDDGGNEPDPERLREDPSGDIFEPGGDLLHDTALPAPTPAPITPYAVFTSAHDRVVRASDLPRGTHPSLDVRRDLARLVNRLQRRLLARQVRDWNFDLEEGLIDAARLDRVIVNPGFAAAYKQERQSEFRNSAVTILIDNSGSMRGKPIEIACVASDLISTALERCHVSCEILGFTTCAWKGGQSFKDWVRAGRPANPGRLNDVLHVIYKSADEPVRRSRVNLSAMLQPELLKENIDGEALLWAARRLLTRAEQRKVLIVISDGAPIDQGTLENNADRELLDRHLRQVIAEIESSGALQLAAIGVKHDVDRYYRNCVRIADADGLGASLVEMIDRLLR
jgi:cobaltochelatase CobT